MAVDKMLGEKTTHMQNFVKNAGMVGWRRLLYVLPLIALSPITANPCRCIEYATPACAEYWRAKAVFIVLVIEIDQPRNKYDAYPEGTKVHLLVEEVLSGKVDKEVFDTQGNGADCKLIYEKGERYLIYDFGYDPKTKMIATSVCQGNIELRSAQGDLDYMRDLATKPPAPYVISARAFDRDNRPMRSKYVRVVVNEHLKPITLELSIHDAHSVSDDEIRREIDERP